MRPLVDVGRVPGRRQNRTTVHEESVMRTALHCAVLALVMMFGLRAFSDDKSSTSSQQKHCQHAKVTKISSDKDSITVELQDKSGSKHEQTFQLGKDVEFRDSSGNKEKLGDLKAGDDIVITQKDGKVCEIKEQDEATITKVDPQNGTVTLSMKGKDGKQTEKVFKLTEDAEYLDSSGRIAKLDVFRSGDQVLIIEGEGRLSGMKKSSGDKNTGGKNSDNATASKQQRSDNKSSNK
jgi:hypothetical protein